ncbi:MAG: DUF2793 domain-containing protein [Croceibacterium sp.]
MACEDRSTATPSGQAQKEFSVNEAHALTDSLLHAAIEGVADLPPDDPADGLCWLVGDAPNGEWAGHAGRIACRQAGAWLFVTPRDGMRVLDKDAGQDIRYSSAWLRAGTVSPPVSGTMVDNQARSAIVQLIEALVAGGILPAG